MNARALFLARNFDRTDLDHAKISAGTDVAGRVRRDRFRAVGV